MAARSSEFDADDRKKKGLDFQARKFQERADAADAALKLKLDELHAKEAECRTKYK